MNKEKKWKMPWALSFRVFFYETEQAAGKLAKKEIRLKEMSAMRGLNEAKPVDNMSGKR